MTNYYQNTLLLFLTSITVVLLLTVLIFVNKKIAESPPTAITTHTPVFERLLKSSKFSTNPILENTEYGAPGLLAGNCFIDNEESKTLFYYSKYHESVAIYSTTTEDGYAFAQIASEPIITPGAKGEWDDGGVSVFPNCIVKKNDGTYILYYTGSKEDKTDIYHSGNIGAASSTDLINWTKLSDNPILTHTPKSWDSLGVFEASVYFTGNYFGAPDAFQMWYGGSDNELRFQIGYAESSDGIHWNKPISKPVLSFSNKTNSFDHYSIEVHSVVKRNNGYLLFYEAVQNSFPNRFAIGVAYSPDGKTWRKNKLNPILEAGPVGSWDEMGAYHPSFYDAGDRYLLYYVGLDYIYNHRLGVAELNPVVIDDLSNFVE